jgi:hypothetical protein
MKKIINEQEKKKEELKIEAQEKKRIKNYNIYFNLKLIINLNNINKIKNISYFYSSLLISSFISLFLNEIISFSVTL